MPSINIAVTGCGHGELDNYYRMCEVFKQKGKPIDLLVITGDFQAVRNQEDLGCMKSPDKYLRMMDFFKYYNGEVRAPILTIYVGGNHEAVNYQNELHYGGWVAPNIYFMGSSNVIRYKGLTIGGLSGIYKEMDYDRGYTERVPFDRSRMDSGYVTSFHYRRLEIFKLLSYPSKVDVMVTHDWPSRIYQYGDTAQLLRRKPHFQDEVNDMCLGSSPLMSVLDELKVSFSLPHDRQPAYWFAAHLHVKFAAIYPHFHSKSPAHLQSAETEPENETAYSHGHPPAAADGTTRFLALDKCVRGRDYMQVVSLEVDSSCLEDNKLYYDTDWLSVVRETQRLETRDRKPLPLPDHLTISEETRQVVEKLVKERGDGVHGIPIPENFKQIAPLYFGFSTDGYDGTVAVERGNNQTDAYLEMLGLEHRVTVPLEESGKEESKEDPNALDIDCDSAV